jgi:hypothetical protein
MKLGRILAAIAAVLTCALAFGAGSASAIGCKTEYSGPTASFDHSPGTPDAGSEVSFDASGSHDGGYTSYTYDAQAQDCVIADSGSVAISSYSWNFGDGTTGTGVSPKHTYANPGSYTVRLTVTAGTAGSDSTSSTVKTSWKVTLTKPAAPNFWTDSLKRQTITLEATAAGPESVKRVEFYVRGVKVGQDDTAPYSLQFDTTTVSDGTAGIYARAISATDVATNSATRDVKIDNTAPSYTVLSAPTVARPGMAVFQVSFSDAEKLYGNGRCWVDSVADVDGSYCVGAGVADMFSAPYTFSSLTSEGDHTVYMRVSDAAGNFTTYSAPVRIDGTPPETTITGDAFTLGSNEQDVTFSCRVYPDGGSAPAFAACPAATSGLVPGTYRYEAAARDAAGNEDPTPAVRTFTVTAPPPPPPADQGGGQQQQQQVDSQQPGGGGGSVVNTPPAVKKKAGRCSKLKGKKRAACVRHACGKPKKAKAARKRYRSCVKAVTRKK